MFVWFGLGYFFGGRDGWLVGCFGLVSFFACFWFVLILLPFLNGDSLLVNAVFVTSASQTFFLFTSVMPQLTQR